MQRGLPAACLAAAVGLSCALAAPGEQAGSLSARQQEQWRSQIRTALFIPDPLPPLVAKTHGQFEPEPGVVAERVSYTRRGLT
jgi:hypothetical protein